MEAPLKKTAFNLLYTGKLRGDLAILPRLFSFIQQLRQAASPDERVLLLDLGESCMPEAWPCGITQGRAALLVLDAMGYDAANTQDVLNAFSRQQLLGQVSVALVDASHTYDAGGLRFVLTPAPHPHPEALQVMLKPAAATRLHAGQLTLMGVAKGQVGQVRLHEGRITQATLHDLPAATPPNPTIAGTVEFVESEARYYEKKQQG